MRNQFSKLALGIALLFLIVLLVTAISEILSRQWTRLGLTTLTIVCVFIPFAIVCLASHLNIRLPFSFPSVTLVFIMLAQYFGEFKNFYYVYCWWDLLLHSLFGSYVVIVSLSILQGTFRKRQEVTNLRFIVIELITAFSVTIALGTIWEIFEFLGDYFFKTSMVKGGLDDTLTDLMVKTTAALLTSIYLYIRSSSNIKLKDEIV
ncbi:membrane protein [Desulfosporosinus sp. HMP52]|uniref:hypothetical protein n=1 Tax=Desulfosporosinus sp. HMP52 TaxID=1487923 RepID=UPI00051FA2DB|nr:hypothetical protein [Desulfosporosinus sp. HMP52]KGK88148.1 membrane protein [Desulfosporosinus sp. HMP52]